ncbi:hypothetical protein GCM10011495_22490 [Hymenobacter frigidus]|uniref:TonB C-terminal domain-containing protein n=1 Tax=Hymenobacter frigidus TaxID=1524095 RepID=A0ABQ2A565_9BACT|nr:energy transducer TonB [Hymenobacter frigidus]GGH86282.1 hypothetical protein GCM10011495_22490 [Hymenobacter frigidus]
MKILFLTLALLGPAAGFAQQPTPAPGTGQQPIVLRPGHMQVQAHPDANRPDRAPVYPGGAEGLGLFFLEHIKYPAAAQAKQLSGSVLVTATLNADGSVTDPKVARSLSPECDAEALRVVPLLTGWQPAMRRGRPIAMLIQLPVPFGGAGEIKVEQVRRQPKRR